jgi:hypothetical protein
MQQKWMRMAAAGVALVLAGANAPRGGAQAAALQASTVRLEARQQAGPGGGVQNLFEVDAGEGASGVVTLLEGSRQLASTVLDGEGHASIRLGALTPGRHMILAEYSGDAVHGAALSSAVFLAQDAGGLPNYALALSAANLTVAPGSYGTLTITVTPSNGFNQYVNFSCSGLPLYSNCVFTPVTLRPEGSPLSTTLTLSTTAPSGRLNAGQRPEQPPGKRAALAMLLPGGLLLLMVAGGRRRGAALMSLLAASALFGLTACGPRYHYFNNPPLTNTGTPPGTYAVSIDCISSDGLSTNDQSVAMTLVVK